MHFKYNLGIETETSETRMARLENLTDYTRQSKIHLI